MTADGHFSRGLARLLSLSCNAIRRLRLARLVHAFTLETLMETLNSDKPVPANVAKIAKLAVTLIVVGVVLWLVNTYIPMAGSIRAILNIVVVVATCVMVLQAVGLWGAVVRLWTDLTDRISR